MRSMTGFGGASLDVQTAQGQRKYVIELRSFNHRFIELKLRLPPQWNDALLEQLLGQALRKRIHRGSLIVSIRVENAGQGAARPAVQVHRGLAAAYGQALSEISQLLPGSTEKALDPAAWAAFIAAQPGVLSQGEESVDSEGRFRELEATLERAISDLLASRQREGEALAADLLHRLQTVTRLLDEVVGLAEAAPDLQRRKLNERLSRLLDSSTPIDGQRLAQEVALLADRMDVSEEITRLRTHLGEFKRLCHSDGVLGRHLEFLTQEMGREVNTIGSKSQSAEVAGRVVAIKAELERLREQIQNVE
jgi:uncharacterized protein (TIGR00255 family)